MEEGSPGGSPLRSPGALHGEEQPPHASEEQRDAEMADADATAYGSPRPVSSGQQQQQEWSDAEAGDGGGYGGSPGSFGSPGHQFSPGQDAQQQPQQDEHSGGQHAVEHDQMDQDQLEEQQVQQGYDMLDEAADAGSDDAAAAEQQRRLNELEAQLRQPDAVMEPGIMDRLRDYVMANGHPQAAVEHLTDSYVGKLACSKQGDWGCWFVSSCHVVLSHGVLHLCLVQHTIPTAILKGAAQEKPRSAVAAPACARSAVIVLLASDAAHLAVVCCCSHPCALSSLLRTVALPGPQATPRWPAWSAGGSEW